MTQLIIKIDDTTMCSCSNTIHICMCFNENAYRHVQIIVIILHFVPTTETHIIIMLINESNLILTVAITCCFMCHMVERVLKAYRAIK